MSNYSYLFKYIIIGESNVGKSCILLQFIDRKYKHQHDPTIGVEFGTKNLVFEDAVVKLQVWDTAGQESFKSITRAYYRGSIVAIIVYDVTKKDTFNNLYKWVEEAKTYANDNTSFLLVGNKADLEEKREVSYEEGEKFAKLHGMTFIEASAKTGANIDAIFRQSAQKILRIINVGLIDMSQEVLGIKLGPMACLKEDRPSKKPEKLAPEKRSGCC